MLLLVDAGNTRIKWAALDRSALHADMLGRWSATGAVLHAQSEQLAQDWRALPVSRVLLSNVAGPDVRAMLQRILLDLPSLANADMPGMAHSVEWFASQPFLAGVRNGYRQPAQLGCDRFAAMIGAHALFPAQPLIVATCGTATTIDALTADGIFLGGMILPGLDLMAVALAGHTAQLPQLTASARSMPASVWRADNTGDAILRGCLAAQVGAIEAAARSHGAAGTVRCILSGGAATAVAPHLSVPLFTVDNLVLIGLQTVARQDKTLC